MRRGLDATAAAPDFWVLESTLSLSLYFDGEEVVVVVVYQAFLYPRALS